MVYLRLLVLCQMISARRLRRSSVAKQKKCKNRSGRLGDSRSGSLFLPNSGRFGFFGNMEEQGCLFGRSRAGNA